jgi:C4-dicarboxylate transporter, DctM subunit
MITAILIASLFILLLIGVPISFTLAATGGLGLYLVGGMHTFTGIFKQAPLSIVAHYELLALPMFIMMAQLVVASRIAEELFDALAIWIGRIRGGLGVATVLFGAGFGAVSGSSIAGAATMASTSAPAMFKAGYEKRFANGLVAICGTLAMLIPPSLALIIYSLLTDQNTARVMVAGAVPGLIIVLVIIATMYYLIWRDPRRAPASRPYPMREKLEALKLAGPLVLLLVLVAVFLYSGLATVVETAALGATAAFLLALFSGRLTLQIFLQALYAATRASAWIAMILIGATIFGYAMTMTQSTQALITWIGNLPLDPYIIMLLIIAILLILGFFLDQAAILVLTIPILYPVILSLGFDPIWFGVIVVLCAEVGQVTPPMGINVFVVARYTNQRAEEVFAGVWPHVIAHILAIGFFVAFPGLILWLPNLLF